ncbi:hypothetical protein [Cyanobium sp. WKJ7-Wakatipu]|uniref:hypothetical protein n=1 Tax=Cyanobium sp. WKJ7-Wakatipu TaxID=2823726 RepID=UPI0020CCB210|nr:hypothetical protein [Cyanobium sp. WKJ7-Wakatipu]
MASFCDQWCYLETWVKELLHLAHQATVRSLDAPAVLKDEKGATTLDLIADEKSQPRLTELDLEWAMSLLEATSPDELALVQASLVKRNIDLAKAAGISRGSMKERISKAKGKLAAIAGPTAHELVTAA